MMCLPAIMKTYYESWPNNATGADGVKIAVLRKGLAGLKFIQAAAHRRTLAPKDMQYAH